MIKDIYGKVKNLFINHLKSVFGFFTSYDKNNSFTKTNDLNSELVEEGRCNNFSARSEGAQIKYIVQHHTVSDFDRTIWHFTKPKGVSADYVIDKDGSIYQLG